MSTLAAALKDEIRRLARKEIRVLTGTASRGVAQHRREIASLKRQLSDLKKQVASLRKRAVSANGDVQQELQSNSRFSARSTKAQRRRTGLSAADYAKLIGVSPLTIYNWENGKSRPRREQFASLVALRDIGKRELNGRLQKLSRQRSPTAGTKQRRRAS